MNQYKLDLHGEALLEEYRQQMPLYKQLQQVVMQELNELIRKSGIECKSSESRIKGEESLVGKLERKGSKYATINDITDIFGARIITFYNEDVARIASMAEQLFDVDWVNSVDKRQMHRFDSFGYNSLHYICQLPQELCDRLHTPELRKLRFELQMRTALQHVWSAIQHDIGYKSEIETPAEYRAYHILGADAVGMSTVPEAIVAHYRGMEIFALSVITDLGVVGKVMNASHEEVLAAANAAEPKMVQLICAMLPEM